MATIYPGQYEADVDSDFVVFLIGMRFNRPWRVDKWLPIFVAMPRMLRHLARDTSKGLLHYELAMQPRGVMVVQYWRSLDDLMHFARAGDEPHLAAWRRFNRKVGASKAVGIWHETYPVHAAETESRYGNMPRAGLAQAMNHRAYRGYSPVSSAGDRPTTAA
jgi:hypothetical protein